MAGSLGRGLPVKLDYLSVVGLPYKDINGIWQNFICEE
jgi:hypothetical protein